MTLQDRGGTSGLLRWLCGRPSSPVCTLESLWRMISSSTRKDPKLSRGVCGGVVGCSGVECVLKVWWSVLEMCVVVGCFFFCEGCVVCSNYNFIVFCAIYLVTLVFFFSVDNNFFFSI